MEWIYVSATEAAIAVVAVALVGGFGKLAKAFWHKKVDEIVAAAEKAIIERTGTLTLRVKKNEERLNGYDEKIDELEAEQIRQQERHKAVKEQLQRIETGVDNLNSRFDDAIGRS